MASQAEANACALAKCGAATCDVRATFGSGQCGAFAEAREFLGASGFGTGATTGQAIEVAKLECRRLASRARYCRILIANCNQ